MEHGGCGVRASEEREVTGWFLGEGHAGGGAGGVAGGVTMDGCS